MPTVDLLLIEDNPGDIELVREAFGGSSLKYRITAHTRGEAALAHLADCVAKPDQFHFPDLVILDLNLPGLSGREILTAIRENPRTATLPVVIMTSSRAQTDIEACYALRANCYVPKPLDFDEFMGVIQKIEDFWFKTALRPPKPAIG